MNDDVKFCTGCRFYEGSTEKCLHEAAKSTTAVSKFSRWLVDGKGERPPEVDYYYASTMRSFGCGKEAKLFEPIPVKAAA